jgi:uncharacterized protein YukE
MLTIANKSTILYRKKLIYQKFLNLGGKEMFYGMDTEEAIAAAGRLNGYADEVGRIIAEMESLIRNGLTTWSGPDKTSFENRFIDLKPKLNEFVEYTENNADIILGCATDAERVALFRAQKISGG